MAMVKTISWPGVVNHHPRLRAPSSLPQNTGFTSRAVSRETSTCRTRGKIRIGFDEMVAKMPLLEQAYTKFLDCLPTIKGSAVRDKNRVPP